MLQKLLIQNYAIIDEIEVSFSGKLNVITGETGAGKSIIVGALGLILGERADSSVLVNKQKKCVVEGIFNIVNKADIRQFLETREFDESDELIIRREIGTNGKSRAFVNDTPVTLSQLGSLCTLLVDLHQQFDTLRLGESDFQREVLDALAANAKNLQAYQQLFSQWQLTKKEVGQLSEKKYQFERDADYNRFQFNELDEAAFKINEVEDLEMELKMLNNSENIKLALSKLYYDLKESDAAVVTQLKLLHNQLQTFSNYHPGLPGLLERLHSSQIELQDIADETDSFANQVNYNADRIEQINERLSTGYKLLKKHGVKTTAELLQIQRDLEEKLQSVFDIAEQLNAKEKEAEKLRINAMQLAQKLSHDRKKQVTPLETTVNKLLSQVGMPNARLKVEIKTMPDALNLYGADVIEFLFDANVAAGDGGKSSQYQSIRKVASGGEMSRLMLCIKSLVAQSMELPTMIFDEIDTGISGEAARQVGIIMKDLATKRQVICITHQPQIAGKAEAHHFVYKEILDDSVKTNIRLLNTEERITAIARMLSGEKPTAAAIENAREMVMN